MGHFKTWRAFSNFEKEVSGTRRYVRGQAAEAFLSTIRSSCVDRQLKIDQGQGFWRAQLGHDWRYLKEIDDQVPCAYAPKRMAPLKDRALEGRANPKGIPVLYLSTSKVAAMSEIRPWLGSFVSLGYFETVRPLNLIECVKYHRRGMEYYFEEPPPEELDKAVWTEIDQAFSRPVTRSDDTGDYVATQILAELFRDLGFDGVAYRSAFGAKAVNVALFDLHAADLRSCSLHQADSLRFEFKETDNPYWVSTAEKARSQKKRKTKSKSS